MRTVRPVHEWETRAVPGVCSHARRERRRHVQGGRHAGTGEDAGNSSLEVDLAASCVDLAQQRERLCTKLMQVEHDLNKLFAQATEDRDECYTTLTTL